MADDKKRILIEVQFAVDKAFKEVDATKKKIKELKAATGDNTQAIAEQNRILKQQQIEYQAAQKTLNNYNRALKSEKGSYDELYHAWKKAELELKLMPGMYELAANGTYKLTKAGLAATEAVKKQKQALDALGAATANNTLKVGSYTEGIKSAMSSFKSFALAGFGLVGVFLAIKNGISSAWKTTVEFDTALKRLSAITGMSKKEMALLGQAAKSLSIETDASGNKIGKSATEIVNAFTLVGSAKPELLKNAGALKEVAKNAIILSQAAGEGQLPLEEAVKSLTQVMNQFNAPGKDAAKFVNLFAAASKEGAGEVPFIAEAITKFGTAAKAANVSIEQSVAMVELFAEKGLSAEKSGISMRNILIKLQTDTRNYKNGQFDFNLALEHLIPLQKETVKLTEIFGAENVIAAQILAGGTKRVEELTKAITGTNEAYVQNGIQMDTLKVKTKELGNNWDALVLSVDSGSGNISNAFKKITDFVNDAISAFIELNKTIGEKSIENQQKSANEELKILENLVSDRIERLTQAQAKELVLAKDALTAKELTEKEYLTVVTGINERYAKEKSKSENDLLLEHMDYLSERIKVSEQQYKKEVSVSMVAFTDLQQQQNKIKVETLKQGIANDQTALLTAYNYYKNRNKVVEQGKKEEDAIAAAAEVVRSKKEINAQKHKDKKLKDESDKALQDLLDAWNKAHEARLKLLDDLAQKELDIQHKSDMQQFLALVESEKKKATLKNKINKEISDEEIQDLINRNEDFKTVYGARLMTLQQYADEVSEINSKVQNHLSQAQETTDTLYQIDLTNFTTKEQEKLKALKASKDAGLISEQSYNESVEALNNDRYLKEKELKKKYANINFGIQVAQIIGNTAQAVSANLAAYPLPWSLIPAAAVAALGGLQIVLANAQRQQVLAMALGGEVPGVGNTDSVHTMLTPGEGVLTKRAMTSNKSYTISGTPKQIASTLNSKHGGVSYFANGGIVGGGISGNTSTQIDIIKAIQRMPAPILGIKEFNEANTRIVTIQQRASI